jgi:hypothetical protein
MHAWFDFGKSSVSIGIGVVQILSGANFPISTQIIVFVF